MAVQHIFVTLHGVQGHEDPSAMMAAPDWQELAPDLAEHPVQMDLLAPLEDGAFFPMGAAREAPAGVYRQVRLQLLRSAAAAEESSAQAAMELPEKNNCGNATWHCLVLADGETRPLLLGAEENPGASEDDFLSISADQISGRAVIISPDTTRSYEIRFVPQMSVSFRSGDTVRLVLVFFVSPE